MLLGAVHTRGAEMGGVRCARAAAKNKLHLPTMRRVHTCCCTALGALCRHKLCVTNAGRNFFETHVCWERRARGREGVTLVQEIAVIYDGRKNGCVTCGVVLCCECLSERGRTWTPRPLDGPKQ